MKKLKENQLLIWRDILDLGVASSLSFLTKRKTRSRAIKELKRSLLRQSDEHWDGLYNTLKKLK